MISSVIPVHGHSSADENPNTTLPVAFTVVDPAINFSIWDYTTGRDVTGRTVPVGDDLGFIVNDNLANVSDERGMPAFGKITIREPGGIIYQTLTDKAGTASMTDFPFFTSSIPSGPRWDTGNALYPAGTYTINVSCNANQMLVNYPVTGKTFTPDTTVTLSRTPVTILPAPVISSVPTGSGYRNSTVAFTITGSNFEPGPGNTTVEFRNQSTGLIPTTLTSVTTNRIDGMLTIPADASTGSWNVRVMTADGGENTLVGRFSIQQLPQPTITSITPATGVRTSLVTFTLAGTNFQPGAGNTTVTLFNQTYFDAHTANVTAQLTSVTPTAITGNFTVPADSPFGKAWMVNVSTFSGGASISPIVFTVMRQNTPTITSISPATGFRNTTITFTVAGTNFQIGTGSNVSFFNQTYTRVYANVTSVSPTAITARVLFPADAPVGVNSWRVNVTTVDGGGSLSNIPFTLVKPVPTIISITPGTGVRTSLVTFTLAGTNFQPGPGNTTVTLYNQTYFTAHAGNVTATLTSVTATAITGNFTVPADAAFGKWFVNVTTNNGDTSTSVVPFSVMQQNTPAITSISPATGFRNTTIVFTLAGMNFQIGTGSNVSFFNQTYTRVYANVTSVTPTAITARVLFPADAPVGPNGWRVNVTTVDGGGSMSNIPFTLIKPVPTITTITPTTGVRTSLVTFTLAGTNFQPGPGNTTVTLFNRTYFNSHSSNVTAQLTTVTPTTITGNFTVPADAAFGKWFVNVTTINGDTSTSVVPFTVLQQNTPAITSISPATGFRNTTITFTLAGTNFQIGTGSNVSFYNQTYSRVYANVTSVSPTVITARVIFPADAPVGPNGWRVNVTTVDGGGSMSNIPFTLVKPVPAITSITPASGMRTSLVTFTLAGTNFQPGPGNTTVTLFNQTYFNSHSSNVTAQLTSVTSTAITGNFTVPADSQFGKTWTVNVTTTNGGTSTSPIVFTVSRRPRPSARSAPQPGGSRTAPLSIRSPARISSRA